MFASNKEIIIIENRKEINLDTILEIEAFIGRIQIRMDQHLLF
jgi:hypothetical protein